MPLILKFKLSNFGVIIHFKDFTSCDEKKWMPFSSTIFIFGYMYLQGFTTWLQAYPQKKNILPLFIYGSTYPLNLKSYVFANWSLYILHCDSHSH
jgi:hypothetical protein